MGILKHLVIVLAIIITGGTGAFGAEEISYWINPLYPHISDVSELTFSLRAKRNSVQITCYSYEDVKNAMKYRFGIRATSFTLHMVYDFTWEESFSILDQAFDEIREEDEYLSGNIIGSGLRRSGDDGNVYATYSMSYLTTYTQEQYVDQRVAEILAEILTDSMNDEQKEKAIHDWVVAHVEYDTDFQEYSAYSALYLGRTVCQGYALLIYKMLQTVNIPARIVRSEIMNHAWNMVNLCGTWFHLDATWDDPVPDVPGRIFYDYYNKSDAEFSSGYNPHSGWDTSEYPAASISYTEGICDSKGDVNGNGGADLADAVLALKICAGISVASSAVSLDSDVNGDKRIGLEEAVYTLRKIAGLNL